MTKTATMPLERKHVVIFGPKPRKLDGQRVRNVELMPCGCWIGDVWRVVYSPTGLTNIGIDGKPEPVRKGWCRETRHCPPHSAAIAVRQIQHGNDLRLGKGLPPLPLGDGAARLLADAPRVLAEARKLNSEMKAISGEIPTALKGLLSE